MTESQSIESRKRAELEAALERGDIADPISALFVGITLKSILVGAAVSAALSVATYAVSNAFRPKPPQLELGRFTGSLQLQNSDQGLMIPEIYGGQPTVSTVPGSNITWAGTTNVSAVTPSISKNAGVDGTYDAGGRHGTSVASGDAFIDVTPGTGTAAAGFSTSATPTTLAHIQFGVEWNLDGTLSVIKTGALTAIGYWFAADKFRVELRDGKYCAYQNDAKLSGFVSPTPTYPTYLAVVIASTSAGSGTTKTQISSIGSTLDDTRGGCKVPAIIVWSSGIRKTIFTTQQPVQGGKGGGGQTQSVQNIVYDIDLGCVFGRGPLGLLREYGNADVLIDQMPTSSLPTGIFDPGVGPDPTWDLDLPVNPRVAYRTPIDRLNADLTIDGTGVGTGTIMSNSLTGVYPGNTTQLQDPTIQSDIDGKFGANSTPAYRNRAMIVHKQFNLSRWQGIVPNLTAIWQHETLRTLKLIYESLCGRVGVTEYDFTSLAAVYSRGFLISGRRFTPAEVMDSEGVRLAYNYMVTETDGTIKGILEGAEPTVTIPDSELGWLEGSDELPDVIPEVTSSLANERNLPRQIDIKYIDPDKEWDANTQQDSRQITDGQHTELLEVSLTMLASEARTTAQRKLYRDYVSGSVHKFTLPWTYLYLYPGYKITITRAEGFSHIVRLTSIKGGMGVLECEGFALEPSVFTQPAVSSNVDPFEKPPQLIPAMTIVSLLDVPLLRESDETVNNGVGFYAAGTPRTGINQAWQGFVLYGLYNATYVPLQSFELPAIVGTIVSATGLSSDTSVVDRTGNFTVDLYGTTSSLTSVTEAELLSVANTNLAIVGNMVVQFASAIQVADYPNRWELTTLLNGRRGTESKITETFTGKRFVLVNNAVKFVPMEIRDIGSTRSYRAVTVGQSLGDAATVSFAWAGETLKPFSPVNLRGVWDVHGNILLEWTRRARIGGGLRPFSDVPLAEETFWFEIEICSGSTVLRTIRVSHSEPGAPVWRILSNPKDLISIESDGSVSISGSTTFSTSAHLMLVSEQTFQWDERDTVISLTANTLSSTKIPLWIGLINNNDLNSAETAVIAHGFKRFTGFTNTDAIGVGHLVERQETRLAMQIKGGVLRYFQDVTDYDNGPIFGMKSLSLNGSYRLFIRHTLSSVFQASASISTPVIRRGGPHSTPSYSYSTADQISDFGSIQSTLKVRIYQISSLVGRGGYTEATLSSFGVITPPTPVGAAILREDGGNLLREDGGRMLRE